MLFTRRANCYWFTGLPCAGKTTLAMELQRVLAQAGIETELLDGDSMRGTIFGEDVGFDPESRRKHILRMAQIAWMFQRHKISPICAFVSPSRSVRDAVRLMVPNFVEIYVDTPLEECKRRDVKGMYEKARNGEIKQFTGVDAPYEPPLDPEIHVETKGKTVPECLHEIWVRMLGDA